MNPARPHRQQGFSLLELLVAFAILALSLGMLYKAMGGMVRTVGDLELRQQAGLVARGLLQARDAIDGNGWNESGVEGRFAWTVQSRLYAGVVKSPVAPRLHEVTLTVVWGDAAKPGQLQLQTLLPQRKSPKEPVP